MFYDIVCYLAEKNGVKKEERELVKESFEYAAQFDVSIKQFGPTVEINELLEELAPYVEKKDAKAENYFNEITSTLIYELEKKIKLIKGENIPFELSPKNFTFRKEFFSPLDDYEEEPNVISDVCCISTEFMNMMGEKVNDYNEELTLEEFNKKYPYVRTYPVTQIDYIVKSDIKVALVSFPKKSSYGRNYRFCQLPDSEFISAPIENKLDRLLRIFNKKMKETKEVRDDIMKYLEGAYNITNYMDNLTDKSVKCYGIKKEEILKAINSKQES